MEIIIDGQRFELVPVLVEATVDVTAIGRRIELLYSAAKDIHDIHAELLLRNRQKILDGFQGAIISIPKRDSRRDWLRYLIDKLESRHE